MKKLPLLLLIIGTICSCKKSSDTNVEEPNKPKPILHKVGEKFGGGIIIRVTDETGEHGTIVSLEDQTKGGIPWRGNKQGSPNATGNESALANTNKILTFYDNANIAAKVARDYKGGGYNDWCLPFMTDIYAMSDNRNLLGTYATQYWSCQESPVVVGGTPAPYFYSMLTNTSYSSPSAGAIINVRAVREF